THTAVHLDTEIGHAGCGNGFEHVDQRMPDIIRELRDGGVLPAGGDALEKERRKFPLNLVGHSEVQLRRLVRLAMAQEGFRFARIVIAVVIEKNDFAAQFLLKPPRGLDFGEQKSPRKKTAGLLAEANDGRRGHAFWSAAGSEASRRFRRRSCRRVAKRRR